MQPDLLASSSRLNCCGRVFLCVSSHAESTLLPEALAQQVEIVYGDLVDKISLVKSVSGCDIVIHLAGELSNPSRMFLMNLEGTDSLLKSCRQVGIKQIIYLKVRAYLTIKGESVA